LGEALALRWADVDLENARAWVRRQKDGIASDVRLRADLCERLGAAGVGESHERLFRFHQGGNLKHKLTRAKLIALGLPCPTRGTPGWQPPPSRLQWVNFHTFRHTWFEIRFGYEGSHASSPATTSTVMHERHVPVLGLHY
jgi:integrase